MAITLGRAYPTDWQGHPPHMSVRDFQLWRRFQHAHPTIATAYYFDVALGNGALDAQAPASKLDGMWTRLTSFRADVIADTGAGWCLIELRDNAGPGALGSLITYCHLWKADPPDTRPVACWLVTNRIHPDLEELLPNHDIILQVV